MKTIYATLLFLLGTVSCDAQMLSQPGRWGRLPTPAQADWEAWVNGGDLFPDRTTPDRPAGERISMARLRHKPVRKAIAPFIRGLKFARRGAWRQGAEAFEQATTFDPDFSEAFGNLGVTDAALHLYDQAAAALRRAIELDPATGAHHLNYAYVLIRLNHNRQAEPEARTAVALEPANAIAHYLLGLLFAQHLETQDQAIPHLLYAARELPEARYVLAEIYRIEGAASSAHDETARYQKETGGKLSVADPGGVRLK
jgi:tetratricopeptide (TPR) repeat protein